MQAEASTSSLASPPVCRLLRSKGAGVVYGEAVRWENGFSPNAVFWCLATVDPVGPDDGLTHPHSCIEGRVCFCEHIALSATDNR